MARARNIKPKFFQNEELAEIHPLGRLLFIGLWTICDYRGCLEYRPKRIRAQLLPYDDCNTDELLISLEKSGFIQSYTVKGQRYIKIVNFEKHQTPHKNERDAGSEFPDITEKDIEINELGEIEKNLDKDGTTRASSLFPLPSSPTLNPVSLNPDPGTPPNTLVERRAAPPDHDPVPEIFAYWQKTMGHPGAKLDKKRVAKIRAGLDLGYTPRQLCEAIKGCARSSHHMGQNDRNTKYNTVDLIFRSADHIDKFIELASQKTVGGETLEQKNARIIAEFLADGAAQDDSNVIDMEET